MKIINSIEQKLSQKFQRKYCVYTGNGTTAMYLAFLSLERQNQKVLFPAISCTNPVNAAIYAGYEVDFCDVNLENYTIDISSFQKKMSDEQYGIVIPTHIYGHYCDILKIREYCAEKNITVFEDAAQTYQINESDLSVMSFGHTKIFETNDGGGAIFTDDKKLFEKMLKYRERLPMKPHNSDELFNEYCQQYYGILRKSNDEYEKSIRLKRLQLESKDIFIFHCESNQQLMQKLEQESDIIDLRKKKRVLYDQYLNQELMDKPINCENGMWRYSFLYKGNREKLLDIVREHNIDISSWYPSLSMIYQQKKLPGAEEVEKRIVNLWLSEEHTEQQIRNEIRIINKCMEECYER